MSKTLTDRRSSAPAVDLDAGTLLQRPEPRPPAPEASSTPVTPETPSAEAAEPAAPAPAATSTSAPDPAAGYAIRERGYESSFDGGVLWERCTRLDVERGCSSPVFRALRSGRISLVQNKRGMKFRRAPA